ncbi:HpcH/HpaI aldolase/citrate lyase family protein [Klenkia terrae]|uniref:HpcH/HpaI aldolase/citrate lyase family protein n=1 Tax=Klenkia terrae TaxID=1052259 RepID=UPI00361397F0
MQRRTVEADISRSWLLVNGARDHAEFDSALASRADQVILDIEDAVDPKAKPQARASVVEYLGTARERSAWVRINDHSTPFWADDVAALAGLPGLAGVMLAKTEDGSHVTETFDRLGGATRVLALVESALGIEESVRIASARGAFRLAFGSGDYRRDTGTAADDLAMAYPAPAWSSPAGWATCPARSTARPSAPATACCATPPRSPSPSASPASSACRPTSCR